MIARREIQLKELLQISNSPRFLRCGSCVGPVSRARAGRWSVSAAALLSAECLRSVCFFFFFFLFLLWCVCEVSACCVLSWRPCVPRSILSVSVSVSVSVSISHSLVLLNVRSYGNCACAKSFRAGISLARDRIHHMLRSFPTSSPR